MPVLKDEVKLFIVQELACYDTPSQVVETVKEMYGLAIERPQIQSYDPYKVQGKGLSQKYRDIFDSTRKAFLEDTGNIPIASKAFRLRALHRSYQYFLDKKNHIAANQVLEQAAKEVGDYYTNKVKLGDFDGNPLLAFYKQISGKSLGVVQDADIIENESFDEPAIGFDAQPVIEAPKEVKPKTKPSKTKIIVSRD
jgi:hypothetical protein